MTSKNIVLGAGVFAALWLILFGVSKASAAPKASPSGGAGTSTDADGAGNMGTSGILGPSNESGIPGGMTAVSEGVGLSAAGASLDASIRAEVNRIYNAAITPTSTAKNHYDWIAPYQVQAANWRNAHNEPLPVENEIQGMLDALHSAAYPSYIQKNAGVAFNFVTNKLFN